MGHLLTCFPKQAITVHLEFIPFYRFMSANYQCHALMFALQVRIPTTTALQQPVETNSITDQYILQYSCSPVIC